MIASDNMMNDSRRIIFSVLLLISLASGSCSLFKAKKAAPPPAFRFPLIEDGRLTYDGEINDRLQAAGGKIFFSTKKGFVYAVDAGAKKADWRFAAKSSISLPPSLGPDEIIIADSEGHIYGIDFGGRLRWEKKLEEKVIYEILQFRDKAFMLTDAGQVVALEAGTGTEMWRFRPDGAIRTTAVFWNERLILGTDGGKFQLVDCRRGTAAGVFVTGSEITRLLFVDENRLYFSLEEGSLQCLNLAALERRWKTKCGGTLTAAPVVDEGRVYFITSNNVLFCLDKKGGDIIWWRPLPSRSSFSPAFCGEQVIASSHSPLLAGFNKKNGEKTGSYEAARELKSNPLTIGDYVFINLYDPDTAKGVLVSLKSEKPAEEKAEKK